MLSYGGNGHIYICGGQVTYMMEMLSWPMQDVGGDCPSQWRIQGGGAQGAWAPPFLRQRARAWQERGSLLYYVRLRVHE